MTRERPEYSRRDPGNAGIRQGGDRMRRFPYCPRPPPARIPMLGSVQTEDMDRARGATSNGNGGGRPPFLRIHQNDRLPLSREAIVISDDDGR